MISDFSLCPKRRGIHSLPKGWILNPDGYFCQLSFYRSIPILYYKPEMNLKIVFFVLHKIYLMFYSFAVKIMS